MTLPTCPREDCVATIDHWHDIGDRTPQACSLTLGRSACYDHDADDPRRCYAPRVPAPAALREPVALPTAEEVARAVLDARDSRFGWTSTWENQSLGFRSDRIAEAQAALDLIASRVLAPEQQDGSNWERIPLNSTLDPRRRIRLVIEDEAGDGWDGQYASEFAWSETAAVALYAEPRSEGPREKVCRLLSHAHGVTVTVDQLAATLEELGLTLDAAGGAQ